MVYFVHTEFLAGGWLKTYTVREFSSLSDAVAFAVIQTGDNVVSVRVYNSAE